MDHSSGYVTHAAASSNAAPGSNCVSLASDGSLAGIACEDPLTGAPRKMSSICQRGCIGGADERPVARECVALEMAEEGSWGEFAQAACHERAFFICEQREGASE